MCQQAEKDKAPAIEKNHGTCKVSELHAKQEALNATNNGLETSRLVGAWEASSHKSRKQAGVELHKSDSKRVTPAA
jgi:hypothetical protein